MIFRVFAVLTFLVLGVAFSLLEEPTYAADATVVITNDQIVRQQENTPPSGNWVYYQRTASSTGTFRTGPGTPPAGLGSFEFVTPTGADKGFLFNYEYIGTKLADIDSLSYFTFRTSGGDPNQVPAINVQVDFNGPDVEGGFTTLVFEPVYNTDQGVIMDGVWQEWDAYNEGLGKWWSTRDIPGVCAFNCFVTWSSILLANPDATILGGIGLNQGSGNPALTAAIDAFTVEVSGNSITYDFEPFLVATRKDQCKNDGWMTRKRASGTGFTNQGDCVSYVNTGV